MELLAHSIGRVYARLGEWVSVTLRSGRVFSIPVHIDRQAFDAKQDSVEFSRDYIVLRAQQTQLTHDTLIDIESFYIDDCHWCVDRFFPKNALEWTIKLVKAPED